VVNKNTKIEAWRKKRIILPLAIGCAFGTGPAVASVHIGDAGLLLVHALEHIFLLHLPRLRGVGDGIRRYAREISGAYESDMTAEPFPYRLCID